MQYEAIKKIEQEMNVIKKYHGAQKMKQYQELAQKHIEMDIAQGKLKQIINPTENVVKPETIDGWGSSVEIRFTKEGSEVEKVPEPQDFVKAAHYLNFLTAQ
jgi:hypothetical protein